MAAKIFISYSHRDENFKDDLQIGLASLKNNGHIAAWDDRAILAGDEWDHEIKDALYKADIIILLVSPNFLASRYVREQEIKIAMDRHHDPTDSAVVVPVIIRPSDWKDNAFSRLQALPKNSKPITSWSNYDEAMLDVVTGIKKLVMRKPSSSEKADQPPITTPIVDTSITPPKLDVEALKVMIGKGKTEKVIATLLADENLEEEVRNLVVILKNKLHTLKNEQIMDVISEVVARQNTARINYGLLKIIDDLY